jgi:hypothetical protein
MAAGCTRNADQVASKPNGQIGSQSNSGDGRTIDVYVHHHRRKGHGRSPHIVWQFANIGYKPYSGSELPNMRWIKLIATRAATRFIVGSFGSTTI